MRKELSKLPGEAVSSAVSSRVRGEKNFGAQYAGNTPGEAVRIKSKMFDIFGHARQIPLCVRPSTEVLFGLV